MTLETAAIWIDNKLAQNRRFTTFRVILELFMVARQLFRRREVAETATVHPYNGKIIVTALIDGRVHILRVNNILSDHLVIAYDPDVPKSAVALYVQDGLKYM